jgi:hypothetical protein
MRSEMVDRIVSERLNPDHIERSNVPIRISTQTKGSKSTCKS